MFIRESLNQLVAYKVHQRFSSTNRPSLSDLTKIREECVDHLLSLSVRDFRTFLSRVPEHSPTMQQWEMIPDVVKGSAPIVRGSLKLNEILREDYISQ